MPKGPIYIHTEGPFSIQNEDFDVCIFQKRGYGDKIRWCIALVPASLNDEVTCIGLSNDDNDTNDEEESRSRNFALAYIYYWMEVDANEAMNDASSLLLNGTVKSKVNIYPFISCSVLLSVNAFYNFIESPDACLLKKKNALTRRQALLI